MLHMPRLPELLILLAIGLLLFGKRLPEVGRGIGKAIVEFKKGVRGLQDEVDQAGATEQQRSATPPPQLQPPQQDTVAQQSRQPAAETPAGPRPFPG